MKRLNIKLVVSLVIILVTAVVGGYIAHGVQSSNTAEGSRQEADALLKEGKRAEALRQYALYIRQKDAAVNPLVVVDTVKLANRIEMELPTNESYAQAFELNRQGKRLFPDNADLRQAFAEFLMFNGRYEDAIDPLGWLVDSKRGQHDPKFDVMLAQCYYQRDNLNGATGICAALIGYNSASDKFDVEKAQAPHQIDAYEIYARLLREKEPKQPKLADRIMEQMVAANKDSYRAHLARARYSQQYAKGTESKDDLGAALKLAPDDPDVILVAAQSAMIDKKFDESESLLRRGLKLYPKIVNMYRQWAVLKSEQNKPAEAAEVVENGVASLPGNAEMLAILCQVKIQQRDIDGAKKALAALKATNYPKPRVDFIEASILFFDGKSREAAEEFERLRPLLAKLPEYTKQSDLFAAQCYGQLGEYDKQLEAYRRVLQSDPTSMAAQVGVAQAEMALGKTDEAKKAFEGLAHAVGKDKAMSTPQIWRPIVQLRMDEQMRLPKDQRNWAGVDAIIKLLDSDIASSGKAPDKGVQSAIALLKAEIELRKGNLSQARQMVLDAKAKNPADPMLWSALATITYQLEKSPAAALKILDEAPAEIRGNVALRLNHVGILLRQGGDNVKPAVLALGTGSEKLSEADRGRLWSGLGAAMLSLGDQEAAKRFWLKAAKMSPDDLKIRFTLLDLARETGDDVVMSKMVADFREKMGENSAEARYADAARSVALVRKAMRDRTPTGRPASPLQPQEKQSLAAARKTLEEVSQVRANWYEVSRVTGDIDVLEGNVDAAISDYQQALKLGPPNPLTVRPLVLLLSRQNRTEEVKAALDLIAPEYISDLGLDRFAVDVASKTNNFPDAILRAIREVPNDSRDPAGHLWIASLYERAGQPAEAEASFRRAVAVGPEQPETWLRLLEHLASHKKGAGIGDVLIEARKQLPEDRVNQVLGPGYELIGEYPQAEQYYKAALEAAPDDLSTHRIVADFYARIGHADQARKEALFVLREAGKDPKYAPHLLWARRALANLIAASGSYQDFVKAKGLLTENVKANPDDPQDKLRLAELLGSRPGEPSAAEAAVKLLESVNPLPPTSQIRLAQFHEMLGDWTDARREMVKFLSEQKAGPAAYAIFIDMLIRHNEIADALSWLDRLDAIQPTKPGDGLTPPLVLRSRIYVKQGRTDEAVALLKSVLPSRKADLEKTPVLRNVAVQLAQLGLNAAAEDLFREYVRHEPAAKLQLALFLGRTGRLDDALDLCEESLKSYPMPAIMEAAASIFQAQPSRIEPKHIERVDKWFQRAMRDDPESAPLLLQLAVFREISGNVDEAEHIYRDLLHRSDVTSIQRSVALNNLAFSLAGRKKNLEEALAFINEAGQLFGENSDVLDTRGMVYVAMAKYPEALADLSEAVRVTDPSPVKLLHLALAQDLAGYHPEARETLQRAKDLKLDPTALGKVERESYDRLTKDLGP